MIPSPVSSLRNAFLHLFQKKIDFFFCPFYGNKNRMHRAALYFRNFLICKIIEIIEDQPSAMLRVYGLFCLFFFSDVVHPLSFTSNQSLLNKSKRLTRRTTAADAADARNIKKGTLAGIDTRLCAFVMAVFILKTL